MAAYPEYAVSIVQNDNQMIRNQEYDLMIGGTIIQPPKYSSVVLLDDPFRVWLPKDHPLAGQEQIRMRQLNGQPMVGLAPNRFISAMVSQVLAELDVQVIHRVYSDDPLMIRNLVELGMGFAVMPVFTLREIDKSSLCELPIADPFPCLHLVLSWKPDAYHPEPVCGFGGLRWNTFKSCRFRPAKRALFFKRALFPNPQNHSRALGRFQRKWAERQPDEPPRCPCPVSMAGSSPATATAPRTSAPPAARRRRIRA